MALERECFRSDRLTRVHLADAIASPRMELALLAARGGLLGCVLLRLPDRRGIARIDSVAVARAARRGGLGVRLVAWAERTARRAGAGRLRLEVRRANRPARALYAARGYREVAALPRHYADGAHGIRLEKAL